MERVFFFVFRNKINTFRAQGEGRKVLFSVNFLDSFWPE